MCICEKREMDEESLRMTFDVLDSDSNGLITSKEVQDVFKVNLSSNFINFKILINFFPHPLPIRKFVNSNLKIKI